MKLKSYYKHYFRSYLYLPQTIEFLVDRRKEVSDKKAIVTGININIILSLTSTIESLNQFVLNNVFIYNLKNDFTESSDITFKLIETELANIEKMYFKDLGKYWKLIFGNDLIEDINSNLNTDLKMLFQYRNFLVHGKEFSIYEIRTEILNEQNEIVHTKNSTEYSFGKNKYKILLKYFKKNNLIEDLELMRESMTATFADSKKINHFIAVYNNFIKAVILKLNTDYKNLNLQLYDSLMIQSNC